jgi:PAS domain S-box-containing protein
MFPDGETKPGSRRANADGAANAAATTTDAEASRRRRDTGGGGYPLEPGTFSSSDRWCMHWEMPTRRTPPDDHLAILHQALIGEAVDHSPMLAFVADEDMRYVAVNRRACEVLGYTREELLKLRVLDVASYSEAEAEYSEMIAEGFRAGVSTLRRKDGGLVEFRYFASEAKIAGLPFYLSFGVVSG